MIHAVLEVLKDKLNEYFQIKTAAEGDLVRFIDSGNNDPVSFTNNAITPFLMNVSEDRVFRNPDQFSGYTHQGIRTQANPDIRIELLVLFVSKFSDYSQALNVLSLVIKYFQANRIFDQYHTPNLADEGIDKLILELVSLPLEEQNQVWHALNTSYLPSVLYRIRILKFIDEESVQYVGEPVKDMRINVTNQTIK